MCSSAGVASASVPHDDGREPDHWRFLRTPAPDEVAPEMKPDPLPPKLAATSACPRCGSRQLAPRRVARRFLSVVGALAGATDSGMRSWRAAQVGAALGSRAGASGLALGAVAGAVLGALAGGTSGCAVGTHLGDAIDARLLRDLHCHDCGHLFSSGHDTSRTAHRRE